MFINDCLIREPLTVEPEDDVKTVFNLLSDHGYRQAPVVENGRLVGIVSDRDLRMALIQDGIQPGLTVGSVMTPDPVTIFESTTIREAVHLICKHKFNALPVVSETGNLVGNVSTINILSGLIDFIEINSGV